MFEVYCLTSPSGKRYVGFTSRGMDKRWIAHARDARKGSRLPLHRAIRKYGPESFTRSLLERMTTEAGAKRAEQLWIKELGTFASGYNATLGGDGLTGLARSPETRAKIAKAHRGKKHSPEWVEKAAEAHRGKKISSKTRARMSEAQRGRKHPPETLAKMSKAQRGRTFSPETRAKMSEIARMRPPHSPETRAKMSASHRARLAQQKPGAAKSE